MATTRRSGGTDDVLLGIYLNDHLAGASGGVNHIRRMARAYADTPLAPQLRELAEQIAGERAVLRGVLDHLGIPVRRYKLVLGWLAELASRFKPNGRVTRRSPLTALLDLELMRSAVMGKRGTWQTLRMLPDVGLTADELERLLDQTTSQMAVLDELSERVRARVFRPRGTPGTADGASGTPGKGVASREPVSEAEPRPTRSAQEAWS